MMNNGHIYFMQVLFVTGIAAGSQVLNLDDKLKWLNVARYIIYILTITGIPEVCRLVLRVLRGEPPALQRAAAAAKPYVLIYLAAALALLLCEQALFHQNFLFVFLGYLVVQYPGMAEADEQGAAGGGAAGRKGKTTINYGVGMACSYFEGYLMHILPSDGHKFVGFEENIRNLEGGAIAGSRESSPETHPISISGDLGTVSPAILKNYGAGCEVKDKNMQCGKNKDKARKSVEDSKIVKCGAIIAYYYSEDYLMHVLPSDGYAYVGFEENIRHLEDTEGVLFPVKKMFIVVTKDLYSPPDLKEFNRGTDVPYLETLKILPEIRKSVAGVKDRIYHNTAYKIYRTGAAPVCLTVECASPLHTLYRVIGNSRLYDELADIDIEEVKSDFCNTLQSILRKSHECRGKCEFVFYDHEDPTQNLAELLLQRIRELCPKFEEQILARRAENILAED